MPGARSPDRLHPPLRPLEHARARVTPSDSSSSTARLVLEAELVGLVRVAGQRQRAAGVDQHLQERHGRVQLADRLAQPGGRDLDGDARLRERLDGGLVVAAQVASGTGLPCPRPSPGRGGPMTSYRPESADWATVSK